MGSCLNNQLFHLKQADELRIAQGMQPQYTVARYLNGGTQGIRVNGSASQPLNRVQLELPVDSISTSLMTLEVAADSLSFIVNSSPGEVRMLRTACMEADDDSHKGTV